MKIYKDLEQRSEEWHNVRAGKLTASSFHTLLGNSETKKTLLLKITAERITNKCIEDNYSNEDIERGIELEDDARNNYQENTFNLVEEVGFAELDEYVGCSPDGIVGNDGLIEIKCPRETTFLSQVLSGRIKPEYITQMQFNMYVLDRKWCDYVMYSETLGLFIKRVERDEKFIEEIKICIEECKQIIQDNINKYNDNKGK
jgi:exodeoxyribonuclease (lambda-induced)